MNDGLGPAAFETPSLLQDLITLDLEPAAPEAAEISLHTLGSAIERLETAVTVGVSEVLSVFRDKLAFDRFKEDQINRQHEELQAYRTGLVHRASRQILQGVIRLHDDFGKVAAVLRRKPAEELTPQKLFQHLEGFQDDIELLLIQYGVEKFEVHGVEFDPRRQTALRTVPTEDPSRVGLVAERLRPGFQQGEVILQKQRVAVYAAA